jgi:hypothetical protein
MLSRSSECRARMQQASLVPMLIRLSKSKNAKICDSASQALNCLSENSTDGIEEGTVAALIAIALDGNAASKTDIRAEDYLQRPDIPPLDPALYAPSDNVKHLPPFKGLEAHPQKILAGPAGKGPKPPKPPSILDDKKATGIPGTKAEEELMLDQEEDNGGGVDKIMMFAKMDLPPRFQEEDLGRMDDGADGAGPDDFKLSSDLEDPTAPPLGGPDLGGGGKSVVSMGSKTTKNPLPQSRISVRQKPGSHGHAATIGAHGRMSQHHTKRVSTAASGKTMRKVTNVTSASGVNNANGAPDRQSVLSLTELELKHPDPIRHGPKDKAPNFFETNEFLANVRMPHEWVDEGSFISGNSGAKESPTGSPETGGLLTRQVTVAEKAAELGLWTDAADAKH